MNENAWSYGEQFMKYLRLSDFNGLTGRIEFNQMTGYRKNITIGIVDLIKDGLSLVKSYLNLYCKFESINLQLKSNLFLKVRLLERKDSQLAQIDSNCAQL